jgi:MFS family permease
MQFSRSIVVSVLGTTQTLAWASSYYLPAILADDVAAACGVSRAWVFGAFSASLLLAAVLGPAVGRQIERTGGAYILVISIIVFTVGPAAVGLSGRPIVLALSWAVLGVGMTLGLYDVAFATLARLYGRRCARSDYRHNFTRGLRFDHRLATQRFRGRDSLSTICHTRTKLKDRR